MQNVSPWLVQGEDMVTFLAHRNLRFACQEAFPLLVKK